MAQLRRAGVPSAIIAKLVVEKVARKWTPLEAGFEQRYLRGEIDARRLAELHDERAREEERELRVALGDGFLAWDREHTVQTMYLGGLQPAEAQKEPLYALQKDWLKRLHALEVAQRNGILDLATCDKERVKAEADYKTKLAAIIGAGRVDGLSSAPDPAVQVRDEFARLQLSDAQVEQLAAVQKQWTEARAAMAASLEETKTIDAAYEGDLRALDRARDEDVRRILGAEAFDRWQRSRDDRYRALRDHAASWSLDQQQVDRVYDTIRAYDLAVANYEHQAQVRAYSGQAVDWAAIETALADYTRETGASLRHYLGRKRFEQLQATGVLGLRTPVATDR